SEELRVRTLGGSWRPGSAKPPPAGDGPPRPGQKEYFTVVWKRLRSPLRSSSSSRWPQLTAAPTSSSGHGEERRLAWNDCALSTSAQLAGPHPARLRSLSNSATEYIRFERSFGEKAWRQATKPPPPSRAWRLPLASSAASAPRPKAR